MNKKTNSKKTGSEIELVFDKDQVLGVWYQPELQPVLCTLCGKDCKEKRCTNVNPFCG